MKGTKMRQNIEACQFGLSFLRIEKGSAAKHWNALNEITPNQSIGNAYTFEASFVLTQIANENGIWNAIY